MRVFMPEFMINSKTTIIEHNQHKKMPTKFSNHHPSKSLYFQRTSPNKQTHHKHHTLSLLQTHKSLLVDNAYQCKKVHLQQFSSQNNSQQDEFARPIHSRGSKGFRKAIRSRSNKSRPTIAAPDYSTLDFLQIVKKSKGNLKGTQKIIQPVDKITRMNYLKNRTPQKSKQKKRMNCTQARFWNIVTGECRPWSPEKMHFEEQPEQD